MKDSNYDVQELVISDIKRIPIKERQYMGAPGYVVHVSKLAMHLHDDKRFPRVSRQVLSFKDVVVRVKEHSSQTGEWTVTDISGMSF